MVVPLITNPYTPFFGGYLLGPNPPCKGLFGGVKYPLGPPSQQPPSMPTGATHLVAKQHRRGGRVAVLGVNAL